MSVLERQPLYELQVYKLLLGAADLAGAGSQMERKSRGSWQIENLGTPSEHPFHQNWSSHLPPIFTPKPLLSLEFVSCLKYSFFSPHKMSDGLVREKLDYATMVNRVF